MDSCGSIPIIYNAAVTACDEAKQWQEALQLLGQMCRERMWPDTKSYSAAKNIGSGAASIAPPPPIQACQCQAPQRPQRKLL